MTNTIRKRLGPVSVVATIAVLGILAAFIALAALPDGASAQSGPPAPPPPGQGGGDGGNGGNGGSGGPPPPPPPPTEEPTPDPNAAPVVTGDAATVLIDLEMHINTTHDPIDVADAFSDADGDALTYRAMSDDTDVANATIVGSVMTVVSGNIRGTANITVTASDGNGGSVTSDPFTVTVIEVYTLTSDPEWNDDHLRAELETLRPNLTDEDIDELLAGLVEALQELEDDPAFIVEFGRPQINVVLKNSFDPAVVYVAKFNLAVAGSEDDVTVTVTGRPNDAITITDSDGLIGAGFVDAVEGDLEGSLTVKATDAGSRAFEIEGMCEDTGAFAIVDVDDKDLNRVAQGAIICLETGDPTEPPEEQRGGNYSVASYGDWEYDDVTDGFLVLDAAGPNQMVNAHHTEKGHLSRDEPVVAGYELGISDVELLTKRIVPPAMDVRDRDDWVPEGQGTIQVLFGTPDVQITVTSTEAGPAYIRFLNSDMRPFGTDVDEEPMWRGADVVGLDSQGRLTMNMKENLSAAEALAYDQFNVVVPFDTIPGDQGPSDQHDADDSELHGIAGSYYQGAFRFFNPCPSEGGLGHHFYVEVYEKTGKYRKAVEKVMCEGPLRPGPTGLRFEVDSDVFGQGIASYNRAINSDSHTVLLVNAADRTIVAQRSNAGTAETFKNLNNGWEYHLIVIAENRNGTYNADAITARVRWIGQSPAPQSPIGSPAPTGSNILCRTGQYQVMKLLADCDLGMVTGLTAEAGANPGTASLTWTSGANATMHWLAGIKVSDWQAQNFANTIFRATSGQQTDTVVGLSSGEQYAFTVVSGRSFDTGETEWHDSWAEIQYVTPE